MTDSESNSEYKKRVLDTKSPTFCGAKWYNATIWLGSGKTASCHLPPGHVINVQSVLENPKAIHNTPQKKFERAQMQNGLRPAGCEFCWKIEDLGSDNISDRVHKSRIFSDESLNRAMQLNWKEDAELQTLEIAFDRVCNFACSYCNPEFSTQWVNDIRNNGPYVGLEGEGMRHFMHAHDDARAFSVGQSNAYVEAFFKWWESSLHKSLKELRVTGGEPTMSSDFWRIVDWFSRNPGKSEVRFAINSNLGGKGEVIERLIDASNKIPHCHLYTSCEAKGNQAEYIRDGLNWDRWNLNLRQILNAKSFEGVHVMCTVNALCLESLTEFLDILLKYKAESGKRFPIFTLNILRTPDFQSALVLPRTLKLKYADKLRRWLAESVKTGLLIEIETSHVERLITFLTEADKPHEKAGNLSKLRDNFKKFYLQYDKRRNKSFELTFPGLLEWYQNL